ncbi:hypothetical protein NS303_10255 [Pantoea ananatis]|uniref:Uncharacterized protein n=1 Tax=Pantoea ananas TaxID=553 RepID=A0AAJ1CVW9_PANAN|nr:protealysin inhibitor emfourin [Pantoea ananatis]AWQ17834.1 hypothetical protein C1N63_02830 [Pantoea ananatis]KGL51417.1 hypothetical protein KR94_20180 [Pantoea ananatis]KTR48576.1 hypothetical protein NS303_10255 [Pantoea ananatis]KTR54922.1 hypothetical protein NS311_14050 [Pantoea ananatis]KTR64242.1 hypothetical protein RSA47_12890 [Pantoea ananatis]
MSQLPELTDDATIVVTHEGGFAFIPGLRSERRFPLGELPPPEKARVCQVLEQAMPLGKPEEKAAEVGRGDQCYFRIQIQYATQRQSGTVVILVPEQLAPPELKSLLREGK